MSGPARLVQGGHPGGSRVLPGRPLGGLTQTPGHLLGHVPADQVVGVGGHPAGVLEAARGPQVGHQGDQCAGHQPRVHIHPRQVDDRAPGGAVQLLPGGQGRVRPEGLVPPVPDDRPAAQPARLGGEHVEQGPTARHAAQVQSQQGHPGRRVVHVGVDEGGGDQRTVEVDDRIGGVPVQVSAPAAGPIHAIVPSTTSIAPAPGTDGA